MKYFEKIGRTAFITQIAKGKISTNKAIKMYKSLPAEMQKVRKIRKEGRGAEGIADLVLHPNKTGVAIQKGYDPKTPFFHVDTLKDKEVILENFGGKHGLVNFYGKHPKNERVHYTEYIKNKPVDVQTARIERRDTIQNIRNLSDDLEKTPRFSQDGMIKDVLSNKENMINDKIIDFMPPKGMPRMIDKWTAARKKFFGPGRINIPKKEEDAFMESIKPIQKNIWEGRG